MLGSASTALPFSVLPSNNLIVSKRGLAEEVLLGGNAGGGDPGFGAGIVEGDERGDLRTRALVSLSNCLSKSNCSSSDSSSDADFGTH